MRHYERTYAFGRHVWAVSPQPPQPKQYWTYVVEEDPKGWRRMDKLRQFGDRYSESPAALRYGG